MKVNMLLTVFLLFLCLTNVQLFAQKKGQFSGDLQMAAKFYERDSLRNAFGNPFYDDQFYGAEGWLQLNYKIAGFDMGLRFDLFQNTSVFNPTVPFSEQGIGRWYISKGIKKLHITVGHFYEQYGSGAVFRAYEARPLGIDQAMMGINLEYELSEQWRIKAFTARQKNIFDLYKPLVKGGNIEGYMTVKRGNGKNIGFSPGIAVINRTLDRQTMDEVVTEVNTYDLENRFIPKFNTYLFSLYNTLQLGNFSWYLELAGKTEDVLRDLNGVLVNPETGYVGYTTLTYSQKGLGIVLQGKVTEKFDFRVSPNEILNRGVVNYLPSLTRQNTYRLTSRYNAATQPLGEIALQADVTYKVSKRVGVTANFSNITNLDNDLLFREIYVDATLKSPKGSKKRWKAVGGLQMVDYNQQAFEQKGDWVHTLTPFTEFILRLDRKKSIRAELQYMLTKRNYRLFGQEDPNPDKPQDFGDWIWGMVEFNIAPRWSFVVGNMHSFGRKVSFPTVLVALTQKATRLSLSYGKQPDGVICTGGICRFEPAFSGVRFDLTTSF